MAELDVEPKRKSPWWIWLLIALAILALIFFLRGCNKESTTTVVEESESTSQTGDTASQVLSTTTPDWNNVNFDVPTATYEEITDTDISVRGNNDYTIYGLGEDILFATGKSTIQTDAEKQLKQISASLEKRFRNASLAVYGNTDSTGSAGQNQQLGMQRAESVKAWLIENAKIPEDKISIQSKGQTDPVATNETASGRQMNRRVEIVAMGQK